MKIESINIDGIGGIDNLDISFSPGMNIICGPNGIGKTTILECIAQSFTYNPLSYIRKKANRDSGSWKLSTTKGDIYNIERKNFHPSDDNGLNSLTGSQFARDIIYIKTQRSFDYITLKNISNDERATSDMRMLSEGINITDAKNWFVSRHLWSAHSDSLEDAQRHNLEIAKSIFEKTDPDTHFSRVKGGSNDILLKQQDGTEIYFEYLSSGYKSIIFILLGLIKEIEHRYVNENLTVEKFEGVILIDELDLHLHPQWQANLLSVLIDIFPNAQFITSTHSAHIIQAAEPNQIISLRRGSNGQVYKRDIQSTVYGFRGWTVEEILTDVMGLQETRSPLFVETIEEFEAALNSENYVLAQAAFNKISEMLHPNNNLRKLLKIQLASLGSEIND